MSKLPVPTFSFDGTIVGAASINNRKVVGTVSAILEVSGELRVLTSASFIRHAGAGPISWKHEDETIPEFASKPPENDPINAKLRMCGLVSFPINQASAISKDVDPYVELIEASPGDPVDLNFQDGDSTSYYVSNPNASVKGTIWGSKRELIRIRSSQQSEFKLAAALGARALIYGCLAGFVVAYDTEFQIIYAVPVSKVISILDGELASFASAANILRHNARIRMNSVPGSASEILDGWVDTIVENSKPLGDAEHRLEVLARRVYNASDGSIVADQILLKASQTGLALDLLNDTLVLVDRTSSKSTLIGISDYLADIRQLKEHNRQ